ncbi:MAG: hypothetical protein WA821_02295 [Anaerolineales bacterium]
MNTPEMNETVQLAKTFSTACKKVVAEGKTETKKAPVVTVALVALTAGATTMLW